MLDKNNDDKYKDLGDWSLVRPIAVFVVIVRESKTCPHDLCPHDL